MQEGRQFRQPLQRHKAIPARLDEFDPLRLFTHGQAGHAIEVSLFLHTAGVGDDGAGVALQLDHIQVAHRLDQAQGGLGLRQRSGALQGGAGARMQRQHDRPLRAAAASPAKRAARRAGSSVFSARWIVARV